MDWWDRREPGCFVLAVLTRPRRAVLRRYRPVGRHERGQAELVALNPDFPTEKLNKREGDRLIGRVVRLISTL